MSSHFCLGQKKDGKKCHHYVKQCNQRCHQHQHQHHVPAQFGGNGRAQAMGCHNEQSTTTQEDFEPGDLIIKDDQGYCWSSHELREILRTSLSHSWTRKPWEEVKVVAPVRGLSILDYYNYHIAPENGLSPIRIGEAIPAIRAQYAESTFQDWLSSQRRLQRRQHAQPHQVGELFERYGWEKGLFIIEKILMESSNPERFPYEDYPEQYQPGDLSWFLWEVDNQTRRRLMDQINRQLPSTATANARQMVHNYTAGDLVLFLYLLDLSGNDSLTNVIRIIHEFPGYPHRPLHRREQMSIVPYHGMIQQLNTILGLSLERYWNITDRRVKNVLEELGIGSVINERPIVTLIEYLYYRIMILYASQFDQNELDRIIDLIEEM